MKVLSGAPAPALSCDDCNPCNGMTTGSTGVVWCNGAGVLSVLVFTGGDKVLGWDSNGPYWKNP